MAQTGYTPISIYYSATTTNVPTAGNLVAGELAINTADGKLFYKDSSGVVQTIASKATGTVAGSTTQVIYNNAGAYAGSANFTFDGTNVGIGCTPSTWNSTFRALELGTGGSSICEYNNSNVYVMNNNYFNVAGNYVYKTTAEAGQFIIGNGQAYINGADSGTAGNTITFTQIFSVKKDKSLSLQGASPVTGTGISFPASQNASSDANTLDDYEEGTWTPTLGGTTTYTIQAGNYVKVGQLVTCWFDISVSSLGTGSTYSFSGLPFLSRSFGAQGMSGGIGYFTAIATSVTGMYIRVDPSSTAANISVTTIPSTGVSTFALFINGGRITGTLTYQASA